MQGDQQQQKCYVCRVCQQSFASGKRLGDHMRGHLGLISICRKMGDQEAINGGKGIQETVNGEKGVDFDDVMMKKSEEDDGESRREWMKKSVCKQCGKVFDSVKGLHGHMRCHSMKRSQPLDKSSSEEHDGRVSNPVRKKRSCRWYKSFKHDHHMSSGLSYDDDEVLKGALCLMMLSRGVRSLDGLN